MSDLIESVANEEDQEFLLSQIEAAEAAARTTAAQKVALESLTQQASAYLLSISTKHLRDEGVARNIDGTYNGPDLVQWLVDRQISKARKDWERDSDTLKTAVERQQEAKAIKYEEEAKGLQDQYVDRADVLQAFQEMASEVRRESEALSKKMAPDFPAELRDSLTRELDNHVRQMLRRLAAKGRALD